MTNKPAKAARRKHKEVQVTFPLEKQLKAKIEEEAARQNRSISFIVRTAVEKYFAGQESQAAA